MEPHTKSYDYVLVFSWTLQSCFVGRILSSAKSFSQECSNSSLPRKDDNMNHVHAEEKMTKIDHISSFLPTSRRIVQFSNGKVLQLYSLLICEALCRCILFLFLFELSM